MLQAMMLAAMLPLLTTGEEAAVASSEQTLQKQSFLQKENTSKTKGTDSGLYNQHLFEGDILLKDPEEKTAITDLKCLWPEAIVIYKITDNIGCPYSRQCHLLMAAMDHYHRKTCVRFKEWAGEDNFVEIFYNTHNSGACWSEVGMSRGRQRLSLGERCWSLGIILHELAHSIGFWHEMNRPDRDVHIIVHWHNILGGYMSAFVKNSPSTVNTMGEPFDLRSIMMYDEYAFSKDGRSPTIETKSKAAIGPLWKKTELSASDIRRIHKLYKCEATNQKKLLPDNFRCNFTSHTCGFRNRGYPVWRRSTHKKEAYMTVENGSRSQLVSINFLPAVTANTSACLFFTYFLQSSLLWVNQETLSSVTDLSCGTPIKLWTSYNHGKWYSVQMNINAAKPYRLVFEYRSTSGKSSAAIDNVNISPNRCESLQNDVPGYYSQYKFS